MAQFDYSEKAESDILEILEYIARDNVTAALRVNDAIEETALFLSENPGIGSDVDSKYPNLLMHPVKGYENYLLFFQHEDAGVYIQRIFHGARDVHRILNE